MERSAGRETFGMDVQNGGGGMSVFDIHVPEGKIFFGNVLLIVCSLFYLAWWVVAFKPNSSAGMGKMATLLAVASAAGIAGLIL